MEKYISNLLKTIDYENGFYIDAGAYDGVTQDYTYELEKRNWSGILIEPSVKTFNQCVENRSNKNIFINCALVGDDNIESIRGNFDGQPTSSVNERSMIKVPARTLTSILNEYNISNIDLFSLDVEGYEINVLKGLEFDKYSPKYILIEMHDNYAGPVKEYLKEKNYELIANITNFNKKDNPNWSGTHNDFLYQKK